MFEFLALTFLSCIVIASGFATLTIIGGADRFRRVAEWLARRGSQQGITAHATSPGEPATTPDLGSIPNGSISPVDAFFENLEDGIVSICNATLKLHNQTGWMISEGAVTTSLHGPVRVKVLSVGMKAVEYSAGLHVTRVVYGSGTQYDEIRQLAIANPRLAAYGPEYEVELLDRNNPNTEELGDYSVTVARLFLDSREAKAALSDLLQPGAEVILGCKRSSHTRYKGAFILVPVGWHPLDNAENVM